MMHAMNDRELLELAAKAAGLVVFGSSVGRPGVDIIVDGRLRWWSPLTDDGDALRLAVKLNMTIEWDGDEVNADHAAAEYGDTDRYAATRRAIVRAAAAIGEAMP